MQRRSWVVLLLCLGAAAIVAALFYWRSAGTDRGEGPAIDESKQETVATSKSHESTPAPASSTEMPSPSVELSMDADPPGDLRLEGQVLDSDDNPVAGAQVYLSARPRQQTLSGEDGTFAFAGLVGRRYAITARAGNDVGGPVVVSLTGDSDPVVLRLHQGATVRVTVVTRASGEPIPGARVALLGLEEPVATTDGEGRAELSGLPAGWQILETRADGFGTARSPIAIRGARGSVVEQRVVLDPGVSISGVVLDASGSAVKGARVVARNAAQPFEPVNVFVDGVVTGADGSFEIDGLAVGSYRFLAVHDDFAPGSSALTAISESLHDDVRVVLSPGAVVAGTVVDAAGAAASWAQVSLVSAPGEHGLWGGGVQRATVADADGVFRFGGVAREKLSVSASNSVASSKSVGLDMRRMDRQEHVRVMLSVDGAIAGQVVDEAGEPIGEAQVLATPDFWKGGQSLGRSPAFATTDGGGNFRLRGLANGRYLLRASREAGRARVALRKPVAASPGDTAVQIVVARDGAVKGRVQIAGGGEPSFAVVSLSAAGRATVRKGAFEIEAVPPGRYELTVRGVDFPLHAVSNVVVTSGKTVDVGTIKLLRGRAIFGRVTGAAGRPVEGVTVVAGQQIVGDGANVVTSLGEEVERQMGLRRAVTAGDGSYRIAGVENALMAVVADHPEAGRSVSATVAPGNTDTRVDLVLQPLGGLRGVVTKNGQPASDVSVLVNAAEGARQLLAVRSGMDGVFKAERVAAGRYKVIAIIGTGGASQMASAEVSIEPGEVSEVVLEIVEGRIDLEVVVKPVEGATLDAAQVFIFSNAALRPTTGAEINQVFLAASNSGSAKMAFANAGPAGFSGVAPGDYSLCVIPITGDMNDPTFAQRLQRNVNTLLVVCSEMTVAASPPQQTHEIAVPGMKPLPE